MKATASDKQSDSAKSEPARIGRAEASAFVPQHVLSPTGVLALQARAGNAAVSSLIGVEPVAVQRAERLFEGYAPIAPIPLGMRQQSRDEILTEIAREVQVITSEPYQWRGRVNPFLSAGQINPVLTLLMRYVKEGQELSARDKVAANYYANKFVEAMMIRQTAGGPTMDYANAWDEVLRYAAEDQADSIRTLLRSVGSEYASYQPSPEENTFWGTVGDPEFFAATSLLSFGIVDKKLFQESNEYVKRGDYEGLKKYISGRVGSAIMNLLTLGGAQAYYEEGLRNPQATIGQKLWAGIKAPIPLEWWEVATGRPMASGEKPPTTWERVQLFFEGLLKLAALLGAAKGIRSIVRGGPPEVTADKIHQQVVDPKPTTPTTVPSKVPADTPGGTDAPGAKSDFVDRKAIDRFFGNDPELADKVPPKSESGDGGLRRAQARWENFPQEKPPDLTLGDLEAYRQVAQDSIDDAKARAAGTTDPDIKHLADLQIKTQQLRIDLIDRAEKAWFSGS